jgi:hypothetical protein
LNKPAATELAWLSPEVSGHNLCNAADRKRSAVCFFALAGVHPMSTYPITLRGAEKLKAELHQLKTVERPAVINAIAEARAQGDLSENAEYDAAKDRQGFVEGRIQEIEKGEKGK